MKTGVTFEFGWAGKVDIFYGTLAALISVLLLVGLCLSTPPVYAAETSPEISNLESRNATDPEIGIEIGALTLLGTDVRLFFRQADSPWLIGYRHLDIEDDFVNEAAVGLPADDSDNEYTKRSGPYVTYLFDETGNESFYLAAALLRAETTLVCSLDEVSDSTTSVYFGGGFRKKWNPNLGYNIGLLVAPTAKLSAESSNCSSESEGDFDLNASLIFAF